VTRVLRIGVDARELLGDATGVGRYLGELMRRWTAREDAGVRRFILYTPGVLSLAFPSGTVEERVIGKGTGTWWEQTSLRRAVRADRPDVFFAPAYTAPLAIGAPLAVTIHDISFIAHPEWFRFRERWRRRLLTTRTAAAASVILTVSNFSRDELERRLNVTPERIRVIPSGIAPHVEKDRSRSTGTGEPRSETPDEKHGVTGSREPLVLYVGSIFNRRRLPELIAAFARGTAGLPNARLVIVGTDRTWPPQDLAAVAAAHDVSSRVELRRYVSDAELATLYARAAVFAFLSEYEGFGFTPLEALAAGVPVIVLDTPVAREVYGPAATYVRPADVEGTAAVLRRFLLTPEAAAGQLAHAPAVLARYSWDRAAADTLAALEAVARR
jgi:glycosyltransferase involved in cell wall biosynthesis